MSKLIEKYNVQGPRYTSYPPVPFWTGAPDKNLWISHIKKSYNDLEGVDIYIHVPFCYNICHYCGCNRSAVENNNTEFSYVESILKEWSFYEESIGDIRVNSIHFGGGTPTYLSPESFDKILTLITKRATSNFVGSVELHPNISKDDHLKIFKKHNINRISIGVQDLNNKVLDSINRKTNVTEIISLYEKLREMSFESINFDLIYGLPFQTIESMKETFKQVNELRPDVISYYSFAFVPWKMPNQKNINESELPDSSIKQELFNLGKSELVKNGYIAIGLDHFALPASFLGRSFLNKKLQRSFMGYTDKKSSTLIGLGPSAISNTKYSYAQNVKDFESYHTNINTKSIPLFCNGHNMSEDDQLSHNIISNLMCNGVTDIDLSLMPTGAESILEDMQHDGVLKISKNKIEMTKNGMPFVRNVAMIFDHHLANKKGKSIGNMFSRTV